MTLLEYLEKRYNEDHDADTDDAGDFIDWAETLLQASPPASARVIETRVELTMPDLTLVTLSLTSPGPVTADSAISLHPKPPKSGGIQDTSAVPI